MSKISIETCEHCSNYDALQAIMRMWMANYATRDHKASRDFKVMSGRKLRVILDENPDDTRPCDAYIRVMCIDKCANEN